MSEAEAKLIWVLRGIRRLVMDQGGVSNNLQALEKSMTVIAIHIR